MEKPMDIGSLITQYFINPVWDRTGYNAVNTLVYAALAMGALYVIWRLFQKYKVKIDGAFWGAVLAWSVWGSSIRVLTDSIDSGRMAQALLDTAGSGGGAFGPIAKSTYSQILHAHVLDYGLATVTPGIYVVTAMLFLCSWMMGRKLGISYWGAGVGAMAAALNLILLLPMAANFEFAAVPVLLTLGVGGLLWFGLKWRRLELMAPVMAQALDGAATWVTIDWFGPSKGIGYFEQHVVSNIIANLTPLHFALFFLLKIGFAMLAVRVLAGERLDGLTEWVMDGFRRAGEWLSRVLDAAGFGWGRMLMRELMEGDALDAQTLHLALLVIVVIGLAPGMRDLLRMLCGT